MSSKYYQIRIEILLAPILHEHVQFHVITELFPQRFGSFDDAKYYGKEWISEVMRGKHLYYVDDPKIMPEKPGAVATYVSPSMIKAMRLYIENLEYGADETRLKP